MPRRAIFVRGDGGQHAVASNVLGMQVAAFRTDHDGHGSHLDAFLRGGRNAVAQDGEVDGDGAHVGQLAESALHRGGVVQRTVGLLDGGLAQTDVLEADDDVLVGDVQLDVAAFVIVEILVRPNTDVADNTLHAGQRGFGSGDAVVVRRKLVVHKATLFEKCLNDLLHGVFLLSSPRRSVGMLRICPPTGIGG